MNDKKPNDKNPKKPTTKTIGDYYEALACEFLYKQGLTIITTNYTAANVGEIDIIAYDDKVLPNGRHYPTVVIVEVRKRKHNRFASSLETITKAKQRRLIATASHFLQDERYQGAIDKNCDCRFDVLAFDVDKDGGVHQEWLQGAFLAE
ncbi:MAG: YraN family protein [Moraxella sp.]|nr:YraN family protein [Moraxella sp.]